VAVTLENRIVTSIETDMQDLVSESLFGGFNSLKKKKASGQEEFLDRISQIIERMKDEGGFALKVDADLFRRLLDLSTDSAQMGEPSDIVILTNPFNASGVVAPVPGHGDGSEQGGGESSGATTGALSPTVEPAAQVAHGAC
jgi:hypothetical protein